jgi:Rrf2 family cysteine metabolism transcriptional repressor
MKISTKGRYGLRALVDLASLLNKKKKYVSLREIAERQDISIKYLESLFNILKNAKIISSKRGAKGGYYLSRPPSKITALEVIECIEGPISVVACIKEKSKCKAQRSCKTLPLWKRVNKKIEAELKSTTIKDLM